MERSTAKIVGALYLLGFVVGIAGTVLAAPSTLQAILAQATMIATGALLWVLAAAGDVAHGILMYPLLQRLDVRVALGYLAARLAEAGIILVSALCILVRIPLAQLAQNALHAAGGHAPSDLVGFLSLCVQAQEYAYQIGMIALGLAGLLLIYGVARMRYLPRLWIVWGCVGYSLFLVGSLCEVLGLDLRLLHTLPGGLWELCVGIRLLAKGFQDTDTIKEN